LTRMMDGDGISSNLVMEYLVHSRPLFAIIDKMIYNIISHQ